MPNQLELTGQKFGKRVRGDLFVILAEWDLTELERYVMGGRAKWQA